MFGHSISCSDIVPSKVCVKEIEKIKNQAFDAFEDALNDFQNAKKIEELGGGLGKRRIFD
jgi:hypothetical protein